MLEQPLQQKQIPDGKRLILAGRRHVASRADESGKDFVRGAFAVPIEIGAERGRAALGDRARDPSRMLIRRRGLWLRSAHRASSANHAMVARRRVSGLVKVGEIHSTKPAPLASVGSRPRTHSVDEDSRCSGLRRASVAEAATTRDWTLPRIGVWQLVQSISPSRIEKPGSADVVSASCGRSELLSG